MLDIILPFENSFGTIWETIYPVINIVFNTSHFMDLIKIAHPPTAGQDEGPLDDVTELYVLSKYWRKLYSESSFIEMIWVIFPMVQSMRKNFQTNQSYQSHHLFPSNLYAYMRRNWHFEKIYRTPKKIPI